ncbi:hypothetical protein QW131_27160 [Roseibium salinum]|nr:hypothetical protein [Roseibium salinum]
MAVVDDPHGGEPVALLPLEAVVEGVTSQDIEVVEIRPGLGGDLGPSLRPPNERRSARPPDITW